MKTGLVLAAMVAMLGCGPALAGDSSRPEPTTAPPVAAQAEAADAADPGFQRRETLARRYFAALHFQAIMDNMMKSLLPVLLDSEIKRYPSVPPKFRQALTDSALESVSDITPLIADETVKAMAKLYTEEELAKLVEFYESPTGQTIMTKAPQMSGLMSGSMRVVAPQMRDRMMAHLCKKIDCRSLPKSVESHPS